MLPKLIPLLFFATIVAGKFRFDNYTLYKVVPTNEEHLRVLRDLQDVDRRFDIWGDLMPSSESVGVLSSPGDKIVLEEYLKNQGIPFSVSFPNIQE